MLCLSYAASQPPLHHPCTLSNVCDAPTNIPLTSFLLLGCGYWASRFIAHTSMSLIQTNSTVTCSARKLSRVCFTVVIPLPGPMGPRLGHAYRRECFNQVTQKVCGVWYHRQCSDVIDDGATLGFVNLPLEIPDWSLQWRISGP